MRCARPLGSKEAILRSVAEEIDRIARREGHGLSRELAATAKHIKVLAKFLNVSIRVMQMKLEHKHAAKVRAASAR